MTQSRLLFVPLMALVFWPGWSMSTCRAEEISQRRPPLSRLLESGPGSHRGSFMLHGGPPDTELLPTNFLVPIPQNRSNDSLGDLLQDGADDLLLDGADDLLQDGADDLLLDGADDLLQDGADALLPNDAVEPLPNIADGIEEGPPGTLRGYLDRQAETEPAIAEESGLKYDVRVDEDGESNAGESSTGESSTGASSAGASSAGESSDRESSAGESNNGDLGDDGLGDDGLDDDGLDDDGLDEDGLDEEDSNGDAESARSRSTMENLRRLRKPIGEVVIEATEDERTPENEAANYSRQEPPLMIVALEIGPPLPDRYTICFKHRPLYFEQRNLERCGRSFRYLQNAVSGVQFVANTMVLPYRMCAQPAACPIPAGGDCKTCQTCPVDCGLLPLDARGLMTEAAAIAGFTFLLL